LPIKSNLSADILDFEVFHKIDSVDYSPSPADKTEIPSAVIEK
jgi:hypothetical protein